MVNKLKNIQFCFLLIIGMVLFIGPVELYAQNHNQGNILMDLPEYPLLFELDTGETQTVVRGNKDHSVIREIKLVSVKLYSENNLWFEDENNRRNYAYAEVMLEVDGKPITLFHRPYQMPTNFNGLRLYVECIKEWNQDSAFDRLEGMEKEVRLSVCAENETWGSSSFVFPIENYRWRSSAYNNTWTSLVPYNLRYYHRGDDYGAIPDKFNVIAPFNGQIVASPLPDGDGASNAIFIRNTVGIVWRISHMNIETINPDYPVNAFVEEGSILAKTGMTWGGRKAQISDPHCHVDIRYNDIRLASFPYLMEAYLRSFPDEVLAIAGGYKFVLAGETAQLDARRSIARPGDPIKYFIWKLHNGKEVNDVNAIVEYDKPGLYTEELMIVTEGGAVDRDFIQVQVYGAEGKNIGRGWAYYYPVRDIQVGTPVLFWNKLLNTTTPVIIDFGDGKISEMEEEITHHYKNPGNYVVTLFAKGPRSEPITVKLEVVVE